MLKLSHLFDVKCCLFFTLSVTAEKHNVNRGVFDTINDVYRNLSRNESLQIYQKERSE